MDDDNERLLFAEEAAELISEILGRPFTVTNLRKTASKKTKRNPFPSPETHVRRAGPDGKLLPGKASPKYSALKIFDWALNRPGKGGGEAAPEIDGYWNARQCCEAAGITRAAWSVATRYKSGKNPAPDPVPAEVLPEHAKRFQYWLPDEVRAWNSRRLHSDLVQP